MKGRIAAAAMRRLHISRGCQKDVIGRQLGTIKGKKDQLGDVVLQINHQVVPISLSAHFKSTRRTALQSHHRWEEEKEETC